MSCSVPSVRLATNTRPVLHLVYVLIGLAGAASQRPTVRDAVRDTGFWPLAIAFVAHAAAVSAAGVLLVT